MGYEGINNYEGLNAYEYNQLRRQERRLKNKSRGKMTPQEIEIRDGIWNILLSNFEGDINAYQALRRHTYSPKAHPDDDYTNDGIVEVFESQRKFMQYKSYNVIPGDTLSHIDLKSAYATSLAGLDKSLKFFMSYNLLDLEGIMESVKDNYFSIVDIKASMPYHPLINLYTTNDRIYYKRKKVSEVNKPNIGEIVSVNFKISQCPRLKIHHLRYLLEDLEREMLDVEISSVKVSAYDLVDRSALYEYETLLQILEHMTTVDKSVKTSIKAALVSFTGMLMNVDPGMRAIMLARCEEVMHRIRNYFLNNSSVVQVMGVQIDAIYYKVDSEYEDEFKLYATDVYHEIVTTVYNVPKSIEPKWLFNDEVYGPDKYKETPFRLQEVRNG